MKKSLLPTAMAVLLSAFSTAILPVTVFAACDQGDAPDCTCFNDGGAWDAGGLSLFSPIQNVANDTFGTEESCNTGIEGHYLEKDSGKPYYSIVLGYNTRAGALMAAELMSMGLGSFEHRQAWCSEAISYWHREANIPYFYGYRTDWHPQWLVKTVLDLKTWYQTEEDGGRGRWIEATEIDYNDFRPGINAPLPGAYMAWTGYAKNLRTRSGEYYAFPETSHSLLIDEMWIHRDGHGRVFQVEVSFLEGNYRNRVRKDRKWDDLIVFTPQGSQWIAWNRGADGIENTIDDIGIKIYGFGVDLDAAGQPVYDESRLHVVDHQHLRNVYLDTVIVQDDEWDGKYALRVSALRELAAKLRQNQGPEISCSSAYVKCIGLPDGGDNSWQFPSGIEEEITVQIDFLAPHPLPVKGVTMYWDPSYLPQNFQVRLGDADNNFFDADIPDFEQYIPQQDVGPVPISARLDQPMTGIRYLQFIFPEGTFSNSSALMRDLLLPYDEGNVKDADENPEDVPVFVDIKPGSCPNTLGSTEGGTIQIALLGTNTVAAGCIVPESLLFNGNSLKLLSSSSADLATPYIGSAPGCHTLGGDGHTDLVLEYDQLEFITSLGLFENLPAGRPLPVRISGKMNDNCSNMPIVGQDFVRSQPRLPPMLLLLEE
jgi:hypothetical protein